MPSGAKRGTTKAAAKRSNRPVADRPDIPYGLRGPKQGMGLLPWARASERMRHSYVYWVATTRRDGRPHSIPVWGVWLDDAFYFSNGALTARNLVRNPAVSVNLGSGEDVVIIEGVVEAGRGTALIKRINDAYGSKYLWKERQDEWYALRPEVAFAWMCPSAGLGAESVYAAIATRWRWKRR